MASIDLRYEERTADDDYDEVPDVTAGNRKSQATRMLATAVIAVLPVIATLFLLSVSPDHMATKAGKILFYSSFIWMGTGMLALRLMIMVSNRKSGR